MKRRFLKARRPGIVSSLSKRRRLIRVGHSGCESKDKARLRTWTVNFYDDRSMCQCFTKFLNPPGKKKKKKERIERARELRDFQKTSPRDPFTLDAYRGYSAIISFIKQTVRLISFRLESTDERGRGTRDRASGSLQPIKNSWPIDKPIMRVYIILYTSDVHRMVITREMRSSSICTNPSQFQHPCIQ